MITVLGQNQDKVRVGGGETMINAERRRLSEAQEMQKPWY